MITLVEALNYKCLRYISQPMDRFHVLVGLNASGKSTFLDVIAFLSDLVTEGLDYAIEKRTDDFRDLLWKRKGSTFELAIEAKLPDDVVAKLRDQQSRFIRYEVGIGPSEEKAVSILHEKVILKAKDSREEERQMIIGFPEPQFPPESIFRPHKKRIRGERISIYKERDGNDHFFAEGPERIKGKKSYNPSFRFGPQKAALTNVPVDDKLFPASRWLGSYIKEKIHSVVLDSRTMAQASLPAKPGENSSFIKPDGSNIAWMVRKIRKDLKNYKEWLSHINLVLSDIADIGIQELVYNKAKYLVVHQNNGVEVPSWMLSDGTLRLFALTLLAYLPDMVGTYLIEEPENGIHPKALEVVLDSLRSVYEGQVLLASHSALILKKLKPSQLLCFAKDKQGATDIVMGHEHPRLRDWQGETNLGVFFASGVLG